MTRILHLSADYPDAIAPTKTRAIAALVEGTPEFDHRVYSLNRTGGSAAWLSSGALSVVAEDGAVRSCRYAAPPYGITLGRAMRRLAADVAADLVRRGESVDLVHGHKLSIEGLAARHLAHQLGVPYLLTVQGNSDRKILSARPDLIPQWRQCWREARQVVAFAPWAAEWVGRKLGERIPPASALPCIVASEDMIAPVKCPPIVRTAFHLDGWKNKNLAILAKAIVRAKASIADIRLEIAGGGSAEAEKAIQTLLDETGIADVAQCVGPLPPRDLQTWMNGAAVFALPSRRESFGMVFLEALMAGCPVIHPAGAAIDGYFPGQSFVRAADASDPAAIANSIVATIEGQSAVKASLQAFQDEGGLAPFRRDAILARYAAVIRESLA